MLAYIIFERLWESNFDNIVSTKNKMQNFNPNQLKLEAHYIYKKDEKITTNFKPAEDTDVKNKAYLDKEITKIDGQISCIVKNYNEDKLHNKEDILIERAVRTTIPSLNDRGLFDNYSNGNAHEVSKDYLLIEDNKT